MLFALKNAGATYQREMAAIFHDMIHYIVEDYINNIVVKSRRKEYHVLHLKKVFEICRKYQLKMNPSKCAFSVGPRKFLWFVVHKDGIRIDIDKAYARMNRASKEPKTTHAFHWQSFLVAEINPWSCRNWQPITSPTSKEDPIHVGFPTTSFIWSHQTNLSFVSRHDLSITW